MTRTADVTHCAYAADPAPGVGPHVVATTELAIFGSKVAALEYAVDNGMKYVAWRNGQTLAEAIAAAESARKPKTPALVVKGATA